MITWSQDYFDANFFQTWSLKVLIVWSHDRRRNTSLLFSKIPDHKFETFMIARSHDRKIILMPIFFKPEVWRFWSHDRTIAEEIHHYFFSITPDHKLKFYDRTIAWSLDYFDANFFQTWSLKVLIAWSHDRRRNTSLLFFNNPWS